MPAEAIDMVYAAPCAVSSVIVHYWGAQKTVKFSCRRCWKNRDTVVLLHRSPNAGIFSATKHVHLGSADTQQVGAPDTSGTLRELIGITPSFNIENNSLPSTAGSPEPSLISSRAPDFPAEVGAYLFLLAPAITCFFTVPWLS